MYALRNSECRFFPVARVEMAFPKREVNVSRTIFLVQITQRQLEFLYRFIVLPC